MEIITFVLDFIKENILPNIGLIFKILLNVSVGVFLLRLLIPVIWQNILVGIIKISDKNKEKDDE